jgi:LacI family transcriptional regulator
VARISGVSTATVSNVLNNADRPVHPRTRERVLEAVRHLNYHPNAMARGLVGRRLETIGVHFGTIESEVITNPYASLILQGILLASSQRGYNVTLWTKRWYSAMESAASFGDGRADGYIVVAPPLNSDIVCGLAAAGLALVAISSQQVPRGVPFVDVDNITGLRIATEHVIALGHRRIAHIGGDSQQPSVADRRRGYREAMAAAGLPVPPEYLVTSWYMVEECQQDARRLLQLPNRPTAIVTGSDHIAHGLLKVARELGIRVPEELSVTGFDDLPSASLVEPQLTTVRQPLVEIGQKAAQILFDRIEGVEMAPESVVATPTLVVRGSTAPAP